VDDVLRGKPHLAIPTDLLRRPGLTVLNHAVGMMAAAHVDLDLAPLYRRRVSNKLKLDVKADSVLPEEQLPGVIQISTCYDRLGIPSPSDFPQPVTHVGHGHAPPTPAAAAPAPDAVPVETAFWDDEPVYSADSLSATSFTPAPAGTVRPSAPTPVPSSAIADHFSLMEEFLRTEEDIMTQLAGPSSWSEPFGAAALPAGALLGHVPIQVQLPMPAEAVFVQPTLFPEPSAPPPPGTGRQTGKPGAGPEGLAPQAPKVDLTALLLQVVSERTGYPEQMLGLDQDLEADLGIDSIKRVEIFGALRGLSAMLRFPAMATWKPSPNSRPCVR
jgi:hypothetical protein